MENRILGTCFQIIGELSRGGFGQTFLAEDLRFEQKPKCVVKQLKPQSNDPNILELAARLFEQEVRMLYQLGQHPQIPSLIAHFEENGEFYFVQEYIEGETLAQELDSGRIYNAAEVYETTRQLLEVLSFVHKNGVIHRDVKPSNIIRRRSDGKIVLIDFGAVKQVRSQAIQSQNTATVAIGSDGYMPMEQLAGHPKFSSDVYAVGMFAIQMLTQTHPSHLRQSQRTGEWVWQDKTSVNPHFAQVLNGMVRLDFRQRYPSAIEALNSANQLRYSFNRQGQQANQGPGIYGVIQEQDQRDEQLMRQAQAEMQQARPRPAQTKLTQTPPIISQDPMRYAAQPMAAPINGQPIARLAQYSPAKLNNAPLERREPTDPSLLSQSDNLPSLGFGGLSDIPGLRILTGIGIILIAVFAGSWFFMNVPTASSSRNERAIIQAEMLESHKKMAKEFAARAGEREEKAKTSADWYGASREWDMGFQAFQLLESTGTTAEEREYGKQQVLFFLERKTAALMKADRMKSKEPLF